MTIDMAEMLLVGAALWLGVGALIALPVLAFGVGRLDHGAEGASIWFRLALLPGVILLWPAIVLRVLSGRKVNQPIADHDGNAA